MCHPKIGALQASCDPDQDSVVMLYLPVFSDTIQTLLKLFLQQLRHLPLHLGPEFLDAPDSVQPTQLIEVHAWLHELGHASVQHRPGNNDGQNYEIFCANDNLHVVLFDGLHLCRTLQVGLEQDLHPLVKLGLDIHKAEQSINLGILHLVLSVFGFEQAVL